MKRILIHLLLSLCLLWQGSAFAIVGSPRAGADLLVHEQMHREMQPHHHLCDGGVNPDDSASSVLYTVCDAACSAALVTAVVVELAFVTDVAPRARPGGPRPAPFLEGPVRPPRLLA